MENFFCNFSIPSDLLDFCSALDEYSLSTQNQVFLLDKPLFDRTYKYNYQNGIILLVPKHRIIIINNNMKDENADEHFEDIIEDIGYISDKFDFIETLGRSRTFKNQYFSRIDLHKIDIENIAGFLDTFEVEDFQQNRNIKILISLFTGSINEADRVGGVTPSNNLENIKKNIILFDTDQTRFIFNKIEKKRISIQGLAGTGKTELLLHKLKELYLENDSNRVAITCYNTILADNLRKRIPEFFNFLKVEKQIQWNERLWAFRSWGSIKDIDSGLYRYICNYYKIPFLIYSQMNSFKSVCQSALYRLSQLENFTPCYEYILVDESQDFPEEFFELCEKVTSKKVFVAGDIFQNIYDRSLLRTINPDFLLNKCYRTDSRTLMFAHGIGLGLFESTPLRWLDEKVWEACGYIVKKNENLVNLSMKPVQRFEELETYDGIVLIKEKPIDYHTQIVKLIESLIIKYPSIKPDDIGIIFLEMNDENLMLANKIQLLVNQKFDWIVNKGYETKKKIPGMLFVSNRNNAKGLEFPFMICVASSELTNSLSDRNTLYMMLTRSFLTSFFILPDFSEKYQNLADGLKVINATNSINVIEPSEEQKLIMEQTIFNFMEMQNVSQYDIVDEIMNKLGVAKKNRKTLHELIALFDFEYYDKETIEGLIKDNLKHLPKE